MLIAVKKDKVKRIGGILLSYVYFENENGVPTIVNKDNPLPVIFMGGGGGGSGGDMLKEVYDTDDDGKVDSAESADSVPWDGITDKPTSFAPSTHTHTIANVTSLQTTLDGKAALSHTQAFTTITGVATEAQIPTLAQSKITGLTTGLTSLQTNIDGKANTTHDQAFTTITGVATAAQIPTLAQSKITSLTSDLSAKLTAIKAVTQADSEATDIEGLVTDFNSLLAKLKTAGLMNV